MSRLQIKMQQNPPNPPRLRLNQPFQAPEVPGLPHAIRAWVFPFAEPNSGLIVFNMNVIAPTIEMAANELKALLGDMMIEVSMQFPNMPAPDVPVPTPIEAHTCWCGYTAQTYMLLAEHMQAMHPNNPNQTAPHP